MAKQFPTHPSRAISLRVEDQVTPGAVWPPAPLSIVGSDKGAWQKGNNLKCLAGY